MPANNIPKIKLPRYFELSAFSLIFPTNEKCRKLTFIKSNSVKPTNISIIPKIIFNLFDRNVETEAIPSTKMDNMAPKIV